MIRKAQLDEVDVLKKITEACAEDMKLNGIFQWNKDYPSLKVIKQDVAENNVYVYLKENSIVGCVMLSHVMDSFYNDISWLTPDKNQLYVHRLAVHPQHQKKGIARALMDFGENMALERGCLSIRLDTFSKNTRNNRFYKARNYQQVGILYFKQKSPYPFYCFEKLLP